MSMLRQRHLAFSFAAFSAFAAAALHAAPTTYHYDGELTPSQGAYAGWFTTVGPNTQGISYFGHTTWSSDGNVLAMNIREIRFLSVAAAMQKFGGAAREGPVILVQMK